MTVPLNYFLYLFINTNEIKNFPLINFGIIIATLKTIFWGRVELLNRGEKIPYLPDAKPSDFKFLVALQSFSTGKF